jgi:hypothetical protein
MIRELAGFQVDRYEIVFRWPMREALIAYRTKVRAAAMLEYRHDVAVWAMIAPHSPKKIDAPKPPKILLNG